MFLKSFLSYPPRLWGSRQKWIKKASGKSFCYPLRSQSGVFSEGSQCSIGVPGTISVATLAVSDNEKKRALESVGFFSRTARGSSVRTRRNGGTAACGRVMKDATLRFPWKGHFCERILPATKSSHISQPPVISRYFQKEVPAATPAFFCLKISSGEKNVTDSWCSVANAHMPHWLFSRGVSLSSSPASAHPAAAAASRDHLQK